MLPHLPGYTIASRAFEGAETILYRGRRDSDGARVAVKVTGNEYPTSRELARLRREFGILTDIGGLPGVVRAYSLEKCGRGLGLVMEDLGASSLHDLEKRQRLDVEVALRLAIALSNILDSIHQLDIIHKDIKPHNIMIDEATLAPRLVDFGIAARLAEESTAAMSRASLEGTLAYMSPEQTGRMNRVVDLRADLYSLGVTLFEVLTGALPFSSTDPRELIHSHIARTPTPPHEQDQEVPRPLSDVVMRLLAKLPEERYQSARGLKADLERCLSAWKATRQIEPFTLGQQDKTRELRLPQKLYGREQDIAALLSTFERVRKGATELLLLSGYAGVGKSALVNELYKPIAHRGGAFVHGKFDPKSRDMPLAPVGQALRELLQQILTDSPAALDGWRISLRRAVGPNGRLLFELVPELEVVIGPQPEVPSLGPTEARNRFELLLQQVLRVFATAEHPLALFLDDLQWADAASLRLLDLLLRSPDNMHLLLLGAYRDSAVDAAHPLVSTLAEIRKAGVPVTELTLRPLDLPTVTQLIAETLDQRESEVQELSALIFDKTQGNPFFLSQFLRTLYQERLVWFDTSSLAFTWDLSRIREALITDNVVDFMLGKLHRLAEDTQRALRLAACIGHAFDLGTLSIIHRKSPAETAADLWGALREGLLLPLDGDYRLLDGSGGTLPGSDAADLQVTYRFLHDRVREAAYALIPEARREEVHLTIGRLLWARSGEPPLDEDLLEIVRHLNLGARGLVDAAERLKVAALNLRASRKAKAATAYAAAAATCAAGMQLLGPDGFARDHALSVSLHIEGAECLYLSGALEQAEALFDVLFQRPLSSLERARIFILRLNLYMTLGKHAEAVNAGLAGLECLGVTLAATPAEREAAFGSGLAEIAEAMRGRRIEELLEAPALNDPEQQAVHHVLSELLLPSYYAAPDLYLPCVLKLVTLSLQRGHSDISAFGYVSYGFVLAVILGRPAEAHAFGKLAFALNERFYNAAFVAKIHLGFAQYLYVCEPLRATIPYTESGRRAALECGDFAYLSPSCTCSALIKLGAGYPLDEIRDDLERLIVIVERTRDVTTAAFLTVVKQVIANLQGKTRSRGSLSDESFDEDSFTAKLAREEQGIALCQYHLLKAELHSIHGDAEAACAEAEEAERGGPTSAIAYAMTRFRFHACLSLLSLPPAKAPEEDRRREAAIARQKEPIARLSALCPQNFQHQLLLIEAEAARRAGKPREALDLYDQAITTAKTNEFPQDEALANELCAKFYISLGKAREARGYMEDAYLGYLHWGAVAKAQDIATEHSHLLPLLARSRRSRTGTSSSSATMTTLLGHTIAGDLREATLIVRAAQGIASEIMLPKVIERLSKIALESAGAERGALILLREEQLFIEATFEFDPEVLHVGPSTPLESRSDLAHSVALFAARTGEPASFNDESADRRFALDPHILGHGVKSVLCLPLLHQGRVNGLLYLENRKVPAALNAVRLELLTLVSSQAAIAIEHARMVADVHAANESAQRANARLEIEVAERTEELRVANQDLSAANQQLQVELAQRERAERERVALQEEMIEAQRERLSEMSTPLIPITDRIMVMPLIGTVDAQRAAQVLEVALAGAKQHRARVVILDITGIKQIDTHVIRTLLRSASTLRLLGTQTVLTGIRPEVAQTMVRLGSDLGSLVTRGTLQHGIAYALELSGELVSARAR